MYDKEKIIEVIKDERRKGTVGQSIVDILNDKGFRLKDGGAIKLKNYYGWAAKDLPENAKIRGKPGKTLASAGVVLRKKRQPQMLELPLHPAPKASLKCIILSGDSSEVLSTLGALWK